LAGWFACEIFDGVWMTNSPVAEDRIKRSQAFLPFATPLAVKAGDTLETSISIRHEEELISWSARVERTGQSARQSTWTSTILDPKDRIPPAKRVPRLSRAGEARRTLLELIDGTATNAEIVEAMLRRHAELFPSAEQAARFVRFELNQSTR
jgi:protein arginine N-methyltransferase 1